MELTNLTNGDFFFIGWCDLPLGMEDKRISGGSLAASSSHNHYHGPDRARLNQRNSHGRTGAWSARHNNHNQWLQIDLRTIANIRGVAIQGRYEAHQWVTQFILAYSQTGLHFRNYRVGYFSSVQDFTLNAL